MIKAIKLLWSKFNVANELIKIIDGLQKENEIMRNQIAQFRARAIEAETLVEKQQGWLTNSRLNPSPSDDNPYKH